MAPAHICKKKASVCICMYKTCRRHADIDVLGDSGLSQESSPAEISHRQEYCSMTVMFPESVTNSDHYALPDSPHICTTVQF